MMEDLRVSIAVEAAKQTESKIDTPPLVAMDNEALEEQSIVQAILDLLQPQLETEDDITAFLNILRDVFPVSVKSKSQSGQYQDTKLLNAVRDQLNEDNMKETQAVMDKVILLVLCHMFTCCFRIGHCILL